MDWRILIVAVAVLLVVTAGCVKHQSEQRTEKNDIKQLQKDVDQLINQTNEDLSDLDQIDLDVI